ncbi:hypothetical protein [uncultured Akkermansia sp.]|uniref:hypothetical protein n=1 Tax=uncultured Akkermansia sp. TaxID=512294 RepID=UPI00261760F6|nr:hypothetical protein [uncultured Akkermansia sp.]
MRQAANYNVHATESLPQSLALHFISPSGGDMDISGMTLRGAVVQDGVIMLDCAVTGASTALVTWPRLAAGCGAYDIFLTDASGKEYPLLKGAVHVVSRVTPPDGTNEAAAVAGALDVSIPETEDGSVTILENPSIVVEELVRQAEAARDEATRLVETLEGQVESGELVNEAVANKLPGALKEAGVELAAATGQSTLSSGDAGDTWTIVGGYAMTWGDEILAGHLPDSCRLQSISTVYFFTDPALNQYCLRVWKLVNGAYSLIGTSAYVSNLTSGQTATWEFTPGVTLQRGDKIIIQVCEGTEMTPYALGMHAVLTPSIPGRGLVTEVADPPAVNGTMAPLMTVMVDYDNGITLGGIELATARQLDSLGRDVRQSSATAEAAARTAGQSAAAASTAASDAATSATAAANSATEAQQALAALPEVDASGNMTLAGNITAAGGTFDGTVNANGGINIPLTVGAPTNESGVNRLYASGLAAVTEAFSPQSFLSDFNLYGGSVAVDQTVPGQVWRLRKMSADPGTIQINLINPFLGVSNYSGWHGFIQPVALGNTGSTAARKLTFALGKPGNVVKKTAAEMDMFTLSPASGSTASFPRFVDVTFYMVNDTSMNPAGYPVRVRELVYDSAQAKWLCYETLSVFPSTNTNPSCNMFLSYQQDRPGRNVKAGLWIGSNAADSRRLLCIADMHGVVDTYSWTGVGALYWDSDGTNSHSYLGAMRQMTAPGYNQSNGAYNAFRALETRLIQSTTVTEFTPYE